MKMNMEYLHDLADDPLMTLKQIVLACCDLNIIAAFNASPVIKIQLQGEDNK